MEMTQEWITQFNKKCAEFLGYVNTTPTDPDFNIYEKKGGEVGNLIEPMSCKFHSDWNWIMEVVEKIEKIGGWIQINGLSDRKDCIIRFGEMWKTISQEYSISKKEAVVQAINQFIDWYNEHK